MNVRQLILFILILGCALFVQSAIAATIVAASDASAASKATAQYVCDGSNDQVELNNALARGGEIVMTEGTFRTSGTISVPGNCIFRGQGPEKTVIAMAGDYAARVDICQPTVTVSNFKITQRGWLMITTSHVKVHDVTIQDSKKTAPTVNGMFFVWASNTVCEDIEFIRCKAIDVGSTGFNLNGQGTPRTNRNIRFDDCLALRCGNEGSGKIWAVGFDFHEGADLYDLVVTDCRAEDCWESGFYFEPNFVNGNDPNKAVPVQVNSRVSNCVAVNNGWRNTEPTRFYMTGFYLSCGVTLNNCVSVNSRNNGFWLWQNSKDITLNSCTDDGSTNSYQVRSGSNLRFYNCISKNADVYALYMWGSSGAIFDDFKIINPKKTSGAVSLGLREDHPNDPWPVTGCTFDILLTGADPNTLIRYYNANNNQVTINGYTPDDEDDPVIPTISVNTSTPTNTTTVTNDPVEPGVIPDAVGKGVAPGTVECENYDAGGEGQAYHDTTPGNEGGDYRQDDVDIESSSAAGSHVVGYNRPGEWLQYTINVTQARTYDVTFRVASPNTGTSFKLSVDGVEKATYSVPDTDNWYTFTEVTKPVALTAGKRVIRVTTTGYHNLDRMTFSIPGQTPTPTPTVTLTATPTVTTTAVPPIPGGAAIPGLIEAENYNTGGEGVAYHDVETTNLGNAQTYRPGDGVDLETATSEGGIVVAWVRPGEWLKYSVNVAESTVYDVSFRVSTPRTDGSFKMQVDGADVCTVMVPNTGDYNTYQTVVRQVSLPAGGHTVRLYFNGYTNVNWVRFMKSISNDGPTPTPEVPSPVTTTPGQAISLPAPIPVSYGSGIIPGTVQAEDFNTGGEGVGYYDTTASNIGGIYRNEDVDIELGDTKDEPVVCYVRPGEWLKYTVNVRGTGDYDVVFRVASPQANTQIKLQVDGVTATTITVPNTGSFDTYTNVTQRVRLTWGPHVLRLMLGGYHNINYVAFGPAGSMTASSAMDPVVTNATTALPTPMGTALPTATPGVTPPANATPPANVTPPTTAVPTPTVNATVTAAVAPTTNATVTTPTGEPTTPGTVVPTATAAPTEPAATPTPTATAGETTVVPTSAAPATGTTLEATALPTPAPTLTATVTATPPSPPQKTAPGGPGAPAPTATAAETTVVPTSEAPATPTVTVAETTATAEPVITEATPTPTEIVPGQTLTELASTDVNLSTFVNMVEEAGLTGLLDGVGPYTVFAPTNEAFDTLPPGALEQLRADPARLAAVLGYHVAEEEYSASDLAAVPEIATLDGLTATVTVQADGSLEVQGARVNRTDIPASNGVLHVIDAVMWPPGMDLTPTTTAPSPTATDPQATTAVPAISTDPTATANVTVAG